MTFVTVFTGYVPEGFADAHGGGLPLAERPITIGYRGRDIGGRYGRLGFEKFEIGRRMKEICDTRGVSNDIAMTEESRIYGKAWFDFVGNCRSMLGSESGSNVFDFDGSIQAKHALMTKRLRRAPTYKEFEPIIADREKQISMGQISPRVFECAVMRTPMVLFRGRYSDAIVADEHYIPLELDFSNAGDVLTRLQDFPALEAMTDRTYTHLVASGNFGYRTYVKGLVKHFEARLNERRVQAAADAPEQLIARSTRQEILSESPADQPKGMDAFRVLQLRLANLGSAKGFAEQAAHLDPIFLKASQRYEKEATDLFALASRLTGKFRSELSDGKLPGESAKDFFETELLRFQNLRYDYQAERTRVVTHCEAAARPGTVPGQEPAQIAVAKLDEQWISLYCSAYSDLLKARAACISAIDMDVMTFLARAPIARANYWGNRALIQIRGSKTEVAKAVVRRMPRVHSLALSAMNAVRKHI